MRTPNETTKDKRGYGSGQAASYIPRTHVGEFGSMGTTSNPIDWKNGRTVELLSQGEALVWHILRWDDDVTDVQEQYPLELPMTVAIAKELGINHPKDEKTVMTSDFLVTYKDHHKAVYSVKANRNCLNHNRTVEKLFIEKEYWARKGILFCLIFKKEVNKVFAENIRRVVSFYNSEDVVDDISILKHLIARKKVVPDMEKKPLNFSQLLVTYQKEVAQWKKMYMN